MSDFNWLIVKAADALACHEYRVDSDDWVPYCTCGWGAEEPYDVDAFDRHVVEVALLDDVPDLLREAKAEAWDEGYQMSELNLQHAYDGHPCDEGETCPTCCQPNPYRADCIEQGGQP